MPPRFELGNGGFADQGHTEHKVLNMKTKHEDDTLAGEPEATSKEREQRERCPRGVPMRDKIRPAELRDCGPLNENRVAMLKVQCHNRRNEGNHAAWSDGLKVGVRVDQMEMLLAVFEAACNWLDYDEMTADGIYACQRLIDEVQTARGTTPPPRPSPAAGREGDEE